MLLMDYAGKYWNDNEERSVGVNLNQVGIWIVLFGWLLGGGHLEAASTLTLQFYNASGQLLSFSQVQAIQTGLQAGALPADALIDPVTMQVVTARPMTAAGQLSFLNPSDQPVAFGINWPTASQGYGLVIIDNGGAGFAGDATINFTYQAAKDIRRKLDAALASRPDYLPSPIFNTTYNLATNYLTAAEVNTNDSVKGAKGQLALDRLVVAFDTLLREYGPTYARVHKGMVTPWLGFTMEDTGNYQADLNKLAAMAGPFAWVRIVFQPENNPSFYTNVVAYAKSKGIKILGTPVDSGADANYTRADYLQRFQDFVTAFPSIDAWEVGNEVNGSWLSADIADRVADAAAYCKAQGKQTYLTLFWQMNTVDTPDRAVFNWVAANLPTSVRSNLDYVGLSQYQEQAPVGAVFDDVMHHLQAEFPTQQIGLSELGYWVVGQQYWWAYNTKPNVAKQIILEQYYKAAMGYDRAYAGGFWWNFASTGSSYDFDSTMVSSVTALKKLLLTPIPVPPVIISNPLPFQKLTNGIITAAGTMAWSPYVTNVLCNLNETGWIPVQTTNGWRQWSASLALQAGTNVLSVCAVDSLGGVSTTNTIRVDFIVPSTLTLLTNGVGSITHSFTGNQLLVGHAYSVTAVPAGGQVFSNWVGDIVATNNPLGFMMQSNMVLQANFIANPFIPVKGTYTGLFYDTNLVDLHSSGFFTLILTDRGTYSCYITIGLYRYGFTGQFTVAGRTGHIVLRPGDKSLTVELTLDFAPGGNGLTGSITDGNWHADVQADLGIFNPSHNPATNYSGRYTLVFPGNEGSGSALVAVDIYGRVSVSGTLADGTPFAQNTALSQDGRWPLYALLYGGRGSLLGWMKITNEVVADMQGMVNWIKVAQPGIYYPAGFSNEITASGSRYLWVTTNRLLNLTNALVSFSGGNLARTFTNDVRWNANNTVINGSSNRLALTISLPTGLFTGSAIDPMSGRQLVYRGVLLQKQNQGLGSFLGTNVPGGVQIEPAF